MRHGSRWPIGSGSVYAELRYFAGLTDEEIATALGVSDRTVRREWQQAQRFLAEALK